MMIDPYALWPWLAGAGLVLLLSTLLMVWTLLRRQRDDDAARTSLDASLLAQRAEFERLERSLREQVEGLQRSQRDEQRVGRDELKAEVGRFEQQWLQQFTRFQGQQSEQLHGFDARLGQFTERTDLGLRTLRQGLGDDARQGREDAAAALARFEQQLQANFKTLGDGNERRLGEVRATLETKLGDIQRDNAGKLEQMRQTVDEKLQATLETRLGASFTLVSERLEQVHRGLGEMQSLASGVGDLKRVLTNVKTRGIWGEMQLSGVLEQVLTPDQYAANVATRPGSSERVEYAIRLPGAGTDGDAPVWLPIDAKFPREDYERLLDAQDRADADAAGVAAAAMERRVRDEAKSIAAKYIEPPHTTDFALMFLPTEGLYAEVLRRPGLVETLQREQRVVIAGPTTLAAILNSLRMGFRTLAIEKRSSEVWQVLGAVKTEFGKFAGVLEKTRKKLTEATSVIDQADVRSRAITRKLRDVEAASADATQQLLGDALGVGSPPSASVTDEDEEA